MDLVDPILAAASQIYALVERVKANKKRCWRVSERVRALEKLLRSIQQRQMSADVKKALGELSFTLTAAQQLIDRYTHANWMERVVKSSSHEDEFSSVNERLNDAFKVLSAHLQVQQGDMLLQVFELASRLKQDEEDRREDDMELKQLLLDHMKQVNVNVEKVLEILNKPRVTDEAIRMIRADELQYDHPKRPFMPTPTSEMYWGRYRGFTVAIKRYKEPANTSARAVRDIFDKEVKTMKRFESPNILRMFGICVLDEDGPHPQFLIVMEYCEKGSLRQVLDSVCRLSWTMKARMCRDAARGLYRLHQTEEESRVHGCISSSKFLVAEGFTVKLGGFELSKTETSLRRAPADQRSGSLCYESPQRLSSINHGYSRESEIYSFGIVMWEIATRQTPFKGCSNEEIFEKVCDVNFKGEELLDDCPESLKELIDSCRAFDSFQRPSAGVLADRLNSVVTELEESR